MKNLFTFIAILTIAIWHGLAVLASPMPAGDDDNHSDLATLNSAIGPLPAHYRPFHPGDLRPDPDVAIITKASEGAALSAAYGHAVRIDSVAGRLVYLHVPADGGPPVHIGTLRGEERERVVELIYLHHGQDGVFGGGGGELLQNGTTAVGEGNLDAAQGCLSHLCVSSAQCMMVKGGRCGLCMVFWCG